MILNPRFYSQDDNTIINQDSYDLKGIESRISESSLGVKSSMKSETNLVKKPCIVRRTTSLYTGVKRIRCNKKPRQTITRRPLKNQCVNNIENNTKIPAIKSNGVVKFLKTSENRLKNSNAGCVNDSSASQTRDSRCQIKKLPANKSSKMALSSEETAIVKHGAKRLKIVSTKIDKGRPEIGESSNNVPENTKSFLCNKQNTKGTSKTIKKNYNVGNKSRSSR